MQKNYLLVFRSEGLVTVNAACLNPFSEIGSLAIAIGGSKVTSTQERRHLGLLFRQENEELKLIHLGWHNKLYCESPNENYCWIPCENIDPVVLQTIADWLSVIWTQNGSNLPYSIKPYDLDPFDLAGKVIEPNPGDGFTCSTFVMWAFYRSHIELIDKSTWENRPEDKAWRQWAVDTLIHYNPNEVTHIQAQCDYIENASRFRPEEVSGAAAIFNDDSIVYNVAKILGQNVIDQMSQIEML